MSSFYESTCQNLSWVSRHINIREELVAQLVKNLPAMQETPVRFLSQEDPLEKGNSPVFCPGEFHGLYSPWGHKESDTTSFIFTFLSVPFNWKSSLI